MNCWEILEIEPTRNKQKIEKAYEEKQAKLAVMEGIEKIEALKVAFDEALKQSENIIEESPNNEVPSSTETITSIQFFEIFQDFLQDGTYYGDRESWRTLMRPYLTVDPIIFGDIQKILRNFLAKNYTLLSREVRQYLIDLCQIQARGIKPENVEKVLNYPDLGFQQIKEIPVEERKMFIQLRNQIWHDISEETPMSGMAEKMKKANSIFQGDVGLDFLYCCFLLVQDFRLQEKDTLLKIQHPLAQRTDEKHWQFLAHYVGFVTKWRASNWEQQVEMKDDLNILIADFSQEFPPNLYTLLTGYVAYLTNNKERAFDYWMPIKEISYRKLLNQEEVNFLGNAEAMEKRKKSAGGTVLKILFCIFLIRLGLSIVFLIVDSLFF